MAIIDSYATLQTAVSDYLARDDLSTFVPNFVQNAENKLYRAFNLRNEETALNVSVSGGVAAVPADFKALKFAYLDESPAALLEWVPIDTLYSEFPVRTDVRTPVKISREGSNFVFGPVSKDGTLRGIYYAKQDPLRTTDPSWYVTNAPDVLLYGALLEAAPFIVDDVRIPVWQRFYEDAVASMMLEEEQSKYSMGALIQRPR